MAEAIHDVLLLPPDLPKDAVEQALYKLQCSALFRGFRGSKSLDISAVADVIKAVGRLIRSFPSIVEIDINPLVVYEKGKGAMALDALILVAGKER